MELSAKEEKTFDEEAQLQTYIDNYNRALKIIDYNTKCLANQTIGIRKDDLFYFF